MLPCVSMCQDLPQQSDSLFATINTVHYDDKGNLVLYPFQVQRVYVGLKQLEHYKSAYTECTKAVDSLNSIVIEQDYNLNDLVRQMQDYNAQLTKLYKDREALLATKPKRTLWWLYAAGGLITGILIAK